MKIKLISPKMTLRPMDTDFKRLMAPSLALLTLAALTPDEIEVYIEDENVNELNFDDTPDFVGITVNIDTAYRAFKIAEKYKNKNIPVMLGGIYPSVEPEESLKHATSICIGEAEELWKTILSDLAKGELKPKYYNNKATLLENVPIPKRKAINKNHYLYTNIISASRGCPFKCDFCYNSCDFTHNDYRNRPIKNVIEEIESLNNKHVMFIDDNFIGNIQWTKDFLKQIKPLKLKWNAAVSTNLYKYPDLIDQMKETGCQSLFIGFETTNKESIKNANKNQNNVDQYSKLIETLHSRDIMINASIVVGFDDDEKDVFKNSVNWLIDHKIETMTAHILTPYPGTVIYKKLMSENRIFDSNLEHYNTSHVVFEPKNMTPKELYNGYIWMYDEFYSLKNIIKRTPKSFKTRTPYYLFNFGYRKFGNITSKVAKKFKMHSFGSIASKTSYGIK